MLSRIRFTFINLYFLIFKTEKIISYCLWYYFEDQKDYVAEMQKKKKWKILMIMTSQTNLYTKMKWQMMIREN